jgi:outer membrane immunogenic protein
MKSFLLATVALAAFGVATQASAADLAARPYTKAPAPVAAGYNWSGLYAGVMGSMWVFGIEADAAGADTKDSASAFILPGVVLTAEDKIRAFGSVTGRVGVAAGAALFYAKGGYGWANNRISSTLAGLTLVEESKTHSGWTIGAGTEYMFAPNWSAKVEYMYADYGSERYLTAIAAPGIDIGLVTHTVKGGINYHFN